MALDTRQTWTHYGIDDEYPEQWPADKDDSGDESPTQSNERSVLRKAASRRSRFTVLQRDWTERIPAIPGSEKTRDGMETFVQKDEADALGMQGSVVNGLRSKGLNVDGNIRERNQFLLSSTTFIPGAYISQVHDSASTEDLYQGLKYLSQSIDQKSASLRDLVESNFERFVRAKSVIDNVYTTMRNQGNEVEEKPETHSRHHSRNSTHWRSTSGQGIPGSRGNVPVANERKKFALTKESEYGVFGIKSPVTEIAVKAEEIWGPAMGGRERENNLKSIVDSVDHLQDIMEIGQELSIAIKRKDYDTLVKQYDRALQLVNASRSMVQQASGTGTQLNDIQIHQVVLTGRMWADVETQIDNFKRGIWRDLTSVQANLTMSTDRSHQEDHVALISVLLELGVEDNPIWVWLLSRYDYLKNKINTTFERSRIEIEVCRRRLASADKPSLHSIGSHFKSPSRRNIEDHVKNLDTGPILEFWELIVHVMTNLLSLQGGILGEVMEFWDRAQSFIDGQAQRSLPTGVDGASRKHHHLSPDGVRDLQSGAIELVDTLREHIFSFFVDSPIDDISSLVSPMPTNAPNTPRTPRSATLSPFSKPDSRFNVDLLSPVPATPKTGEAWEAFAFWPPWANSLSGVHFLGRLMHLLATASSEMATIQPIPTTPSPPEKLKVLLSAVRERSAKAVCVAWNNDMESIKVLEDWTRGPDSKDVTRMPSYFSAFEGHILSGLQRILYIPEAASNSRRSVGDIVTPPPNKLLQMARSQFVTSLYKTLAGIVENAERPVHTHPGAMTVGRDSILISQPSVRNAMIIGDSVDASTRVSSFLRSSSFQTLTRQSLRLLHTLSNLTLLRKTTVTNLLSQFETDFSIALPDEKKTIGDVLTQIDSRLFQSYIRPHAEHVTGTISEAIASPDWQPQHKPTTVRPYVYNVLLHMVALHTELSTTAELLTHPVLSSLFETICKVLLEAFRLRATATTPSKPFNLFCLMQATLDVEFFSQTLAALFGSDKASETQSQIYVELDRTGESRALQKELPEMRMVLRKLKDGTRAEFACFKKERKDRESRRETASRISNRSETPVSSGR